MSLIKVSASFFDIHLRHKQISEVKLLNLSRPSYLLMVILQVSRINRTSFKRAVWAMYLKPWMIWIWGLNSSFSTSKESNRILVLVGSCLFQRRSWRRGLPTWAGTLALCTGSVLLGNFRGNAKILKYVYSWKTQDISSWY